MVQKGETAIRGPELKVECRHHWIIESVDGPTSWGLCKNCGAEKEFLNYSPDYLREHVRHLSWVETSLKTELSEQ